MKNLGNIFYIVTLVKEDMQRQTDNILESGLVAQLGEKIINESTQSNGYMIFSYTRLI
ncbi:hypothetical protein [Anaeromicrobium sediminis]|uniref:hypothetical protein n=1 Tax=Anaeromicrobium sediminis TaxID=1478221 RepID=UPI0015955AFD|nr:hypothetical protein [Anaeromicrobium sediminis]